MEIVWDETDRIYVVYKIDIFILLIKFWNFEKNSFAENAYHIAQVAKSCKNTKSWKRSKKVSDHSSMTLELEEQYKAMHKLPFKRRVLHIDATGRLVFVPKYMHKYNQILTYAYFYKKF